MNKLTAIITASLFASILSLVGCTKKGQGSADTSTEQGAATAETPATSFDPEHAYRLIDRQVSFGPRVPGSEGHAACSTWMVEELRSYGAEVTEQTFSDKGPSGESVLMTNIIASYNPEATRRVLLLAHWDTRPWADKDVNPSHHDEPILGADDAGSGVGVLMEIARQLGSSTPMKQIGVDILLVDGEDFGTYNAEESWCIGSTYWSKQPHKPGYKAELGILLDMVGGKDAKFYWEYYSKVYASAVLSRVWAKASQLGYSAYFPQADGGGVTDDHVPVIKNLGIPTIDIINYSPKSEAGFAPYWHTTQDDMRNISRETLAAVGHTVLATLQDLDSQSL